MPNVQLTSIKTYKELEEEGSLTKGQNEVILAIRDLDKPTDQEIKEYLGYNDPNKCRPRRKELYDLNIIMKCPPRKCEVTGRLAHTWKLRTEPLTIRITKKEKCPRCGGKGYTQQSLLK